MGQFVNGHRKVGGKVKGLVNHERRAVAEKIQALWDGYSLDQMARDLKELTGPERLKIMLGMGAEFCAPKLARTESSNSITVQIEKAGFLLGGKVFYLDGTIPLQIEEHKEDNGA